MRFFVSLHNGKLLSFEALTTPFPRHHLPVEHLEAARYEKAFGAPAVGKREFDKVDVTLVEQEVHSHARKPRSERLCLGIHPGGVETGAPAICYHGMLVVIVRRLARLVHLQPCPARNREPSASVSHSLQVVLCVYFFSTCTLSRSRGAASWNKSFGGDHGECTGSMEAENLDVAGGANVLDNGHLEHAPARCGRVQPALDLALSVPMAEPECARTSQYCHSVLLRRRLQGTDPNLSVLPLGPCIGTLPPSPKSRTTRAAGAGARTVGFPSEMEQATAVRMVCVGPRGS